VDKDQIKRNKTNNEFALPDFVKIVEERWGAGVETHFQEIS